MNNITIIWFGPFGQALTKILLQANNDSYITVTDLDKNFVSDVIETTFVNHKDRIQWISSKEDKQQYHTAISSAHIIILAVWSTYMTAVMQEIAPYMQSGSCLINVNKWLSPNWKICFEEFGELDTEHIHYATLAWGMAAWDVMDGTHTRATLGVEDTSYSKDIKKYFESDTFACERTSDIRWVEYAGVLKNIISIQAGYTQAEQEIDDVRPEIDDLVMRCTRQIQDHAILLWIQKETFEKTYCRDHPEYGDIRTSCYGETRNMKLWRERARAWVLNEAVQNFTQRHITVEGINTLGVIATHEDHPFMNLDFVRNLLENL